MRRVIRQLRDRLVRRLLLAADRLAAEAEAASGRRNIATVIRVGDAFGNRKTAAEQIREALGEPQRWN